MGCSPDAGRAPAVAPTRGMSEIESTVSRSTTRSTVPGSRSSASTAPAARPPSGRTRPSWRRMDARSCTTAADASQRAAGALRHDRAPAHRRCGGPARRARAPPAIVERAQLRRRSRSTSRSAIRTASVRWSCSRPADVGLPLSEPAARWMADVEDRSSPRPRSMSTVAETLMRAVLGDGAWEGFPEPARQMFTGNGPAIVAEFRGGVLDVGAEQLGTIVQPTLLVAAEGSHRVHRADEAHRRGDALGEARAGRGGRHRPRPSRRPRLRPTRCSHGRRSHPSRDPAPGGILPADLAYGALSKRSVTGSRRRRDLRAVRRRRPAGRLQPRCTRWPASSGKPMRAVGIASISSATRPAAPPCSRRRRDIRPVAQPRPARARLGRRLGDGRRRAGALAGAREAGGAAAGRVHPRVRPARASPRCRAAGADARTAAALDGEPPGRHLRVDACVQDLRPRPPVAEPVPPPVYYALGGLSNPDLYGELAERLSRAFDDFTLETFEERHHFDPPHRIEPERLALAARALGACRSRPVVTRRNGLGRRPDLDEAVRA